MSDITWAVGVTAFPRKPSTISETLQSLQKAGWRDYRLSIDQPKGSSSHRGPWKNFLSVLEWLLASSRASHLLIIQDDVQLAANLREFLEESMPPGEGVVSPWCPSVHDDDREGWQTKQNLPADAYGALAYVFTRWSAQSLLLWSWNHKGPAEIDTAVGHWCWMLKLNYWFHRPSLVQHLGVKSTLHNFPLNENRQCRRFRAHALEKEWMTCTLS